MLQTGGVLTWVELLSVKVEGSLSILVISPRKSAIVTASSYNAGMATSTGRDPRLNTRVNDPFPFNPIAYKS